MLFHVLIIIETLVNNDFDQDLHVGLASLIDHVYKTIQIYIKITSMAQQTALTIKCYIKKLLSLT